MLIHFGFFCTFNIKDKMSKNHYRRQGYTFLAIIYVLLTR